MNTFIATVWLVTGERHVIKWLYNSEKEFIDVIKACFGDKLETIGVISKRERKDVRARKSSNTEG